MCKILAWLPHAMRESLNSEFNVTHPPLDPESLLISLVLPRTTESCSNSKYTIKLY